MELRLTEESVKSQFPEVHKTLLSEIKKKKSFKENEPLNFAFNYGMSIGGNDPVPNSNDMSDRIDANLTRIGGSITIKQGRIGVSDNSRVIPQEMRDQIQKQIEKSDKDDFVKMNKVKNLNSIFAKLNITGVTAEYKENTFRSGNGLQMLQSLQQTYHNNFNYRKPLLSELEEAFPEIVEKYKSRATKDNIVIFQPENRTSDEWGFVEEPVLAVSRRDKQIRIHLVELITYEYQPNYVYWMGSIDVGPVKSATPGTEFRGWKKTKQYRFSDEEQTVLISNKIFQFGGIRH